MSEKTIKYFSMFSGIGGFEHGIEKANTQTDFECVGFSEIDKYAVKIYEKHYPNHTNYGDATKIRTETLPDFSFLVGGFPCQAFSLAGKRKGFEDTRGTLFFEIARVLQDKRPRYFLLENVKGLLSHDKGKTFQTILEVLSDLGYYVQWTVFNSKDFGVPQNRERIFIEGYLGGECGPEILSVRRDCEEDNDRRQVSSQYYGIRQGRVHKEDEIMNALACSGHNGGSSQLIKLNNKAQAHIQKVGNVSPAGHHGEDIFSTKGISKTLCSTDYKRGIKILEEPKLKKVGNVYKGSQIGNVYDPNGLSPTHCAGHSDSAIKIIQPVLTPECENKKQDVTATDKQGVPEGYRIRRLTPVECERLQGFPDNWTKYGKDNEPISDTQRYKCCGNAVTTNVIAAIIEEMFQ